MDEAMRARGQLLELVTSTDTWVEANTKWGHARASTARYDNRARAHGRHDGRKIDLSRGPGLGAGARGKLRDGGAR